MPVGKLIAVGVEDANKVKQVGTGWVGGTRRVKYRTVVPYNTMAVAAVSWMEGMKSTCSMDCDSLIL